MSGSRTVSWAGRTALVTGASSGIGAAIARRFARQGLRVVLAARRAGRLEALAEEIRAAGGTALPCPADLSGDTGRQQLFERVQAEWGGVDVLVNNAGLGWYGYYCEMQWATALEILQVNLLATAHLTRLFLPGMCDRHFGRVINIGSVSGGFPAQGIAIYGASKAFLDNFTASLHRELRGSGVWVCVARVGPVKTEFYPLAAARADGRPVPAERFGITAAQVANCVWGLLQHPRRVAYVPRVLAFAPWLELSFGWLMDRIGPLLLRRPQRDTPAEPLA